PVVIDQITGRPGNLTRMVQFAGADERPTLGFGSALRQVAHVLGWPLLLGRTDLDGAWLLRPVALVTGLTAAVVVATLGYLGWRWRARGGRRTALVVMAGAITVGGMLNGSSVPV